MKLLDTDDEFYRPFWVRALITGGALGWALFEFISGAPFWGVLFGALGLYCGYQFFVVFEGDRE